MKKNLFLLFWSIILPSFGGVGEGYAQEPEFAWVKRLGDSTTAYRGVDSPAVGVDEQGNSYLSGVFFEQSFNIDGIPLTSPFPVTSTLPCGYIAKYDSQGQIVWAKTTINAQSMAGINQYYFKKIIIDKEGNIYICGSTINNQYSVISGHYLDTGLSETAYFIVKLDTDGNVLWSRTSSALNTNILTFHVSNEIHFDLDGNINMTGAFGDSITFSPNNTLTNETDIAGVYLTKYSPDGEVLSAKKLDGTYPRGHYFLEIVRTDASGNLYRWSSRYNHHSKILYRYNASGELVETVPIEIFATLPNSTTSLQFSGFSVSPLGDVFIGGHYKGVLNLQGVTYPYYNDNHTDCVVFKLSPIDYSVEWVKITNRWGGDTVRNLLTDPLGNVYVSGMESTISSGWLHLRKLNSDGDLLWEKRVEGLYTPQTPIRHSVTPTSIVQTKNGGNIWVSGHFVNNAYFGEGYHFYASGQNHTNGFLVQYGLCDTANPVIEAPASTQLCEGGSLTLSAELSDTELTYFWSTPTGTIAIEETGTATLTVTQPGKYYLVAQADEECYGKSQEVWVTQVALPSDEVVQEEQTLTATENTENTTYQWVDCDNGNYPVEGATAQSFTPSVSGSYAVEVTNASGCSVVSECYNVSVMSIKDIEQNAVVLYPNPATTMLYLETPQEIKRITIINMAGKTVLKNRNSKEIDVSALAQGYYIITAKTDKGTWKSKFVKK